MPGLLVPVGRRPAPHLYDDKLRPYNGDLPGDQGRMGDANHPSYEGEDYRCAICRAPLEERDNQP